ncbi:MAG: SdrD B-like domain-containing protein, partial [Thiolinea sp.]
LDQLSTTLGSNDGVNDPNIEINLQNIDVRDPDGDANLVEVQLSIWHSEPKDIATSDNCGPPCQIFTVNSVGVYDATGGPGGTPTVIGYDPVSTEDASNNNLPNFNGVGESHPDYVTYPLLYTTPGSWSSRKSFFGANSEAAATGKPTLTRSYAAGDTIPFLLNTWDYRFLDGAQSQVCDKIDTNNFEYVGLAQPNRDDMGYSWNHTQYNPAIISYQGAGGSIFNDGSEWTKFLYSDEPNATLTELRADLCNDDVNGDGFYVIDGIDQASSTATTEPNDWVTDPASLPGGAASVSKIRMETTLSKSAMAEIDPTSTKQGFTSNHLLKIKEDAVGYPNADGKTYLTNMSTSRIHSGDGVWDPWYDTTSGTYEVSIDSNDAGFGYEFYYADRVILVSSSMTIAKYTEPRGLKVVRGGDLVDFIIEPQVLGSWSPAITTATVDDDLPWQTDFVLGSSRFSVDGGNTWLDYDQYQASNPAVTLTSVANGASHDLTWEFDDLQSGEQLPLIRYTVKVRAGLSSGDFYNTATLNSQIGVDETGGPDPDDTGPLRFSGDGIGDPKSATYQLSIYPDFGLDVLKSRSKPVYETNTTMVFDLQYKNLGGENYSGGDFIDILPFNNDGDGRVSSGLDSTRRPGSRFNGTYAVSNISVSNSEVVYATDRAYADIEQDPCHESNQPIGYIPVAGDICHNMYVNNGNQFAGGSSSGNGDTTWTACTDLSAVTCGALSPDAITALRFEVPAIAKEDAGQSIRLELTPLGNVGGTPALDADGNVLAASTGDIYTNNFGGRVPELSLLVISNDVSVTVVSGSIGNYVWRDNNGDTVQDGDEPGLPDVTMELLDGNGDLVYVDSVTGGVVTAATVGAVPYRVDTDTDGLYTFNNLPRSTYSVRVVESTLPAGLIQTFDNSGALDNASTKTLTRLTDALGVITGVENNTDQDFGYRPAVIDLSVQKTIDKNSVLRGETIVYTITVRNDGADTATGVEVVDALPAGISYMSHNFVETYGDGLWEVGSLAPGEVRVLEITAKVD